MSTLILPTNFSFNLNWKEGLLLLLLLHSLPPLNFCYHLNSNLKEGRLLLVLMQYLPPLAVKIYLDMSTLHLTTNFSFNSNWKEGLILLLFLQYFTPLHFSFSLHSNPKEGMLLLVMLKSLPTTEVPISWDMSTLHLTLIFFSFELKGGTYDSTVSAVPPSSGKFTLSRSVQ